MICYLISIGLCQAMVFWFGQWTNYIRHETSGQLPIVWYYSEWIFVAASAGLIGFTILRAILLALSVKKACDALCYNFLVGMFAARQSFFDVTPKGQIVARISKDQEEIETYAPMLGDNTIIGFFILFYIFGLIAISMPYSVLILFIVAVPTGILIRYGWRAIDSMKRRDLLTRSPWYQHTLATVTGLSVIRTFKKEKDSLEMFYELENRNSAPYYLFFCSLRWFTSRADILSILITAAIAVYTGIH